MIANKNWRCNDNFCLLNFPIFYFYKLYGNKNLEVFYKIHMLIKQQSLADNGQIS